MYAVSDKHGIYHLLESGDTTACGLNVIPTVLPPEFDAPMHLVKEKPDGYRLCMHCEAQERLERRP